MATIRHALRHNIVGIRKEPKEPAMNTNLETIPQHWDDVRDTAFFRITAALFAPDFCYGAGVLLASYDPEDTFAEPAPATASYDIPSFSVTPAPTSIIH